MGSKGFRKTHCKYGHELSGNNVKCFVRKDGYIDRNCAICARANTARYRSNHPDKVKALADKRQCNRPPKSIRLPRTHCQKGHELTPDNTYVYTSRKSGKEVRSCRTCVLRNNKRKSYTIRGNHLKRKFGLTHEQFERMLSDQGKRCANQTCRTDVPGGMGAFHVDHDHITGKVRELLCARCNTVLGRVKDDVSILHGLINYLLKHQS